MKTTISVLCVLFTLANISGFEMPPTVINDSQVIIYDTLGAPTVPSGAYGERIRYEAYYYGTFYRKDGSSYNDHIAFVDSSMYSGAWEGSFDTTNTNDFVPILMLGKLNRRDIGNVSYIVFNQFQISYEERVCAFIGDVRICGAWERKGMITKPRYDTLFLNERLSAESAVLAQHNVSISPNPAPSTFITNPTSSPANIAIYTIDGRIVDRLTVAPGTRATWKGKIGRYLVTVNGKGGRLLTINR